MSYVARASLDPKEFYKVLPSQGIYYDTTVTSEDVVDLINRFQDEDSSLIDIPFMDSLLESLLKLSEREEVKKVASDTAHKASAMYSNLLSGSKSRREFRMRLQLLNYFLQDFLSNDQGSEVDFHELSLIRDCPWDQIQFNGSHFYLFSGEGGLHNVSDNCSYEVGKATQLDYIDEQAISVGSIFSTGGYVLYEDRLEYIEHNEPIVLLFKAGSDTLFIDYRGGIFLLENRHKVSQLEVGEVSKVRYIEGKLYVFDWSDIYKLHVYDVVKDDCSTVDLKMVMLGNDIAKVSDFFYVIDKQQGFVFKYDDEFNFISKALRFGIKEGCLYDPISINVKGDTLSIISWVSSKQTDIPIF